MKKSNSYFSEQDQQYQVKSGILKNIPALADQKNLEEFESRATTLRLFETEEFISKNKIDFEMWKNIHKILFQDVYDWAGQIRNVQMSKGSTIFAHPQFIEKEANKIFGNLAGENFLQNLAHKFFCQRLAHYHTELNALHPFREGNGRTLKLLLNEVARRNNFYITWEDKKVTVEKYLAATIAAHNGQAEILEFFFDEIVREVKNA
jgi:cell filamentation protein